MKLIIAGTRTIYKKPDEILALISHFNLHPTEIVSGGASGIDSCAEAFAKTFNYKFKEFKADWKIGKIAGPIRNKDMAAYADELLLIWNGVSKGSNNMKLEMQRLNKKVHQVLIK